MLDTIDNQPRRVDAPRAGMHASQAHAASATLQRNALPRPVRVIVDHVRNIVCVTIDAARGRYDR
jgi:hypothetical protein